MKSETLLNRLSRYSSVEQWIRGIEYRESGISESTLGLYLYYLDKFCRFMGKNPDEIIRERMQHLQSNNPQVKAIHDTKVQEFANWLRDNGASPNTVSVAVAAIKSFYRYNYGALVVKQPRTEVVTVRHVPTREEIARVVNRPDLPRWLRTWIVAQAQSGLSMKELKNIDPILLYQYIESEDPPIIIPMYRGKEHVDFEAVFGSDACLLLKDYIIAYRPDGKLFPYSDRWIQKAVRTAFEETGKYITPHSLRKYFITTLKTAAKMGSITGLTPTLVEYWVGHKLDKTTKAYFIPPTDVQKQIYREIEHLLSFLD